MTVVQEQQEEEKTEHVGKFCDVCRSTNTFTREGDEYYTIHCDDCMHSWIPDHI